MDGDYAATAGATIGYLAKMAGRQPGDPDKAVKAVIQVVEAPNPPLHLVLGPDAIHRTDEMLKAFAADLDAWRSVGMGTNHDDVTVT